MQGLNSRYQSKLILTAVLLLSSGSVYFSVSHQKYFTDLSYILTIVPIYIFLLFQVLNFEGIYQFESKSITKNISLSSASQSPKLESIDLFLVLRGVACALVVLMHSGIVLGRNFTSYNFLVSALTFSPAWLGMGIFFSLSGYLMTANFLSGKYSFNKQGIRTFLRKRFFRIGPLTIFAFILISILERNSLEFQWTAFSEILTFNFYGKGGPPGTDALWSMSTEWMFYCALPFMLIPLFKMRTKRLFIFALGFELLLISLRASLYFLGTGFGSWHFVYFSLLGNMDFFLSGIIAAIKLRPSALPAKPLSLILKFGFLYIVYTLCAYPAMALGKSFWQSLFMIILPGLTALSMYFLLAICVRPVKLGVLSGLILNPIQYLGQISLPLYLLHSELFFIFHRQFPSWSYIESSIVAIPLAVLIAHFISKTAEAYFINMGSNDSIRK